MKTSELVQFDKSRPRSWINKNDKLPDIVVCIKNKHLQYVIDCIQHGNPNFSVEQITHEYNKQNNIK